MDDGGTEGINEEIDATDEVTDKNDDKEYEICNKLTMQAIKEHLKQISKKECLETNDMKYVLHLSEHRQNDCKKIGQLLMSKKIAEMFIGVLRDTNLSKAVKNTEIWTSVKLSLMVCWNFSDLSEDFAKCIAENGIIEILVKYLEQGYNTRQDQKWQLVVQASLSTLHNMARYKDFIINVKDMEHTVKVIEQYKCSDIWREDFVVHTAALFILGYILKDEEVKELVKKRDIADIIDLIKSIMESPSANTNGFSVWELVKGLSQLAAHECNSAKILDSQALTVFIKILHGGTATEQCNVAECLWNLMYHETSLKKIKENSALISALESLKDSEQPGVKKNVNEVLKHVKELYNRPRIVGGVIPNHPVNGHVFISYCWGDQKLVENKIYDCLVKRNYRVWIDLTEMHGNMTDRMMEAVENAYIVIACLSWGYSKSTNCRDECEYALRRKGKDCIVPVIVEKNFQLERWLEFYFSRIIYRDFSGKIPHPQVFKTLTDDMEKVMEKFYPKASLKVKRAKSTSK